MRPARRRGMLSRNPLGMRPASRRRARARPRANGPGQGCGGVAAAPRHRPRRHPDIGPRRCPHVSAAKPGTPACLDGTGWRPTSRVSQPCPTRRPHPRGHPWGTACVRLSATLTFFWRTKAIPAPAARWDRQRCSRQALPRPATGHPGGGSSRFSPRIRRIMRSRHADSAGTASSPYAASVAAAIPSITSSPNSGSVSRSPHSALKASP